MVPSPPPSLLRWRVALAGKFELIKAVCPPKKEVNSEVLADLVTEIFEGALVMAKALNEPRVIADQLREYRNYVELIFS